VGQDQSWPTPLLATGTNLTTSGAGRAARKRSALRSVSSRDSMPCACAAIRHRLPVLVGASQEEHSSLAVVVAREHVRGDRRVRMPQRAGAPVPPSSVSPRCLRLPSAPISLQEVRDLQDDCTGHRGGPVTPCGQRHLETFTSRAVWAYAHHLHMPARRQTSHPVWGDR